MLADELLALQLPDPAALALPRGGVPVAVEIAEALQAPLDIVVVRKVGAPGNPELAVTAIVDAILVDDGATTGIAIKVAIRALKRRAPPEIVVALPVTPLHT